MAITKATELANRIRKEIFSGIYGTKGGLPEVREIANQNGVANNTVIAALSNLEGQGIIEKRGHSYYVNVSSVQLNQYVPPHYLILQSQGKTAFAENIINVEFVALPDEIADDLKVQRGIPVTHRMRVLGEVLENGQKKPTWLVEYYYLISLTDEQRQRMQDDPRLHILLETGPVELQRLDKISSRQPTKEEAQYLRIPETSAVTVLHSVVRDMNNQVLLYQYLVLLGVTLTYDYPFENKPKW